MNDYNPNFRENNFIYLIRQSQELLKIAKTNKNSNAIIYACLDSRIALEKLDLHKILSSVNHKERDLIIKESKSKNGIERINKKIGSLKEKYQLFYQAVCEIFNIKGEFYDFKKSKEIQHKLSAYIHSYHMKATEINYQSEVMQNAFKVNLDAHNFIKSSLDFNGEDYVEIGINIKTIPEEDKILLEEWKKSNIEYTELKKKLEINKLLREKKS